jgi:hypothetical protein
VCHGPSRELPEAVGATKLANWEPRAVKQIVRSRNQLGLTRIKTDSRPGDHLMSLKPTEEEPGLTSRCLDPLHADM